MRQRRRIVLSKGVERFGRRRSEGSPRSFRQLVLFTTDTLSRFDQRRQFVWCQFAKALEVWTSGKRRDADKCRNRTRSVDIAACSSNTSSICRVSGAYSAGKAVKSSTLLTVHCQANDPRRCLARNTSMRPRSTP